MAYPLLQFSAAVDQEDDRELPSEFCLSPENRPGSSDNTSPIKKLIPTVLVVDDDPAVAAAHAQLLSELGFKTALLINPLEVEGFIASREDIDLVLLDMRMPGLSGLEVLRRIKARRPEIGVIMATVITDIEQAVGATKAGAYNYLLKPLQAKRLNEVILSFLRNSPRAMSDEPCFKRFITQSPLFREIFRKVIAYAQADVPILIEGETGTGKELIASIIHSLSGRAAETFTGVNVASLSPQLFESELFGHTRGSFTGALRDHSGYFETAGNGTLFLDEIGELPKEQQRQLLRVLQTMRFARVGDTKERPLTARLVFATNRKLMSEILDESFRSDLYFRFAGHTIELPPLRARHGDIKLLAHYFLEKYRSQYGRSIDGFTDEAVTLLSQYSFPGNVRELEGYISSAVLLEQTQKIRPSALPVHLRMEMEKSTVTDGAALPIDFGQTELAPTGFANDDLKGLKYRSIMKALVECNGNQTRAAERLGIARGTLIRFLKSSKTPES
jgi:DNA-binding NtrC family response regulator